MNLPNDLCALGIAVIAPPLLIILLVQISAWLGFLPIHTGLHLLLALISFGIGFYILWRTHRKLRYPAWLWISYSALTLLLITTAGFLTSCWNGDCL